MLAHSDLGRIRANKRLAVLADGAQDPTRPDSIKFDQDPEKSLEKVEELLEMGRELIRRMNATNKWRQIDAFTYQVLYNTQDGNLIWVLLDFNVTEMPTLCRD